MRVCLIPQSLDAPSSYRLFFPMRELQRQGVEVVLPRIVERDGVDEVRVEEGVPDADVYVLHQQARPEWAQMIPQLQALGRVVVCDSDDLYAQLPVYSPARSALAPVVTGTIRAEVDGEEVAAFRAKKRRQVTVETLHANYAAADCLTVSTAYLAKAYRHRVRRVAVLPNFLDWSMWATVKPQFEVERSRLRVGWMGGGGYRSADVRVLARFLRPWLLRHPEVDFVAAGDPSIHEALGVPDAQRLSFPRVRFRDGGLPAITATMDVGLVPLAWNPFNKAKSALKGMEYAACGVPCVATPTPEYRGFVEDGVTGLLADGPKEWAAALDLLVGDDALRRRMGAAARAKAETLTIQANAWRWRELYEQLVDGCRRERGLRGHPPWGRAEAARASVPAPAPFERPSQSRGGDRHVSRRDVVGVVPGGG